MLVHILIIKPRLGRVSHGETSANANDASRRVNRGTDIENQYNDRHSGIFRQQLYAMAKTRVKKLLGKEIRIRWNRNLLQPVKNIH